MELANERFELGEQKPEVPDLFLQQLLVAQVGSVGARGRPFFILALSVGGS